MNPVLDQGDQAYKRMELAAYSKEQLLEFKSQQLRQMCKSIVKGYANMSKEKMADAIIEATLTERRVLELERERNAMPPAIPEATQEVVEEVEEDISETFIELNIPLEEFTQEFWSDFRKLAVSLYDGTTGLWKDNTGADMAAMGHRVSRYLDSLKNRSGDLLSPFTKLRYRTHIFNALKDALAKEKGSVWYSQLTSALEMVDRACKVIMQEDAEFKRRAYPVSLAERRDAKVHIDFAPLYSHILDILSRLDELPASSWRDVSIALALATGRRSAELHSTAEFVQVGEREVSFSGQLKTKGEAATYYEDNPSYNIPTLVPAELVVSGLEWLKKNNKRVDDPQRAHSRYSKDLSVAVATLRQRLGIESDKTTGYNFNYKGLRSLYQEVCNQVFNPDPSNVLYIAQILGHGRGAIGASGRIVDMFTPQSYNSDFIVTNAQVVLGGAK